MAQSPEMRDIPIGARSKRPCDSDRRHLNHVLMRHRYLLRHPVGLGILAGVAVMDVLALVLSRNLSSAS